MDGRRESLEQCRRIDKEGIRIPAYDIVVCWSYYEANATGWHPKFGAKILSHLTSATVIGMSAAEPNA